MLGLTIKKKGNVHHLAGSIDETADFSAILSTLDRPLVLNWSGIKKVNSQGMAVLIKFAQKLGDRAVEYHDISPAMVEALNFVPLIAGGKSRIGRIKSVIAPMVCPAKHNEQIVVAIKDLTVVGGEVTLPHFACKACREPLQMDDDYTPSDYFFFLMTD